MWKTQDNGIFFFKSYKPLAPLFSNQWIFMNDIDLSIVVSGSSGREMVLSITSFKQVQLLWNDYDYT